MTEKLEGIISQIKNEAKKEGRKEGKKDIITKLLKKYSQDEVSKLLDIEKATLISILQE